MKTAPLINKYYWNEGTYFDRVKSTLKMLLASWTFWTVEKGFRSFNAENLGSIGQRAAKLPAIKLQEWFDFARNRTRADWPTGAGAGRQTFSWDLQLWKLVTLQPFDLKTPYLQHRKFSRSIWYLLLLLYIRTKKCNTIILFSLFLLLKEGI